MTNVTETVTSTDVAQDDYPELEGEIIIFVDELGEETGVVKGCNRSVGLTIVNIKDPSEKLLCFRGPVTPGYHKDNYDGDMIIFDKLIDGIRTGYVDWISMRDDAGLNPNPIDAASCAYGM